MTIQCVPLLTKTRESAIPAISTGLLTEMRTSAFISYCGIAEDHSHGSVCTHVYYVTDSMVQECCSGKQGLLLRISLVEFKVGRDYYFI